MSTIREEQSDKKKTEKLDLTFNTHRKTVASDQSKTTKKKP